MTARIIIHEGHEEHKNSKKFLAYLASFMDHNMNNTEGLFILLVSFVDHDPRKFLVLLVSFVDMMQKCPSCS